MADLLAGRPGPVLDLCAAPGGKATFLARGCGFVVGADVAPARARLVAGNAERLGLPNVAVVVADGTAPPFRAAGVSPGSWSTPRAAGWGSLRRRPDARWRVRPEDVGRLAALQRRLLSAAAPLVAPGGVLVYSVCTLTRAETLGIDEWLAGHGRDGDAERPDGEWQAALLPGRPGNPHGRGALLLPQAAGTDGMYVLALTRAAELSAGKGLPPTRFGAHGPGRDPRCRPLRRHPGCVSRRRYSRPTSPAWPTK